jgi:precorrin-2 dehydrogenase/sirohydrochlorin ferrochelatase
MCKSYYPIFLDLKGKKAVVVGGGMVAQRKIETLMEHGAEVHVISRALTPDLNRQVKTGRVKLLGEEFLETQLDGAFMVIAATDDTGLNRRVSQAAQERGLLVNAVDQPDDCNFIVPSNLKRGDLRIAVSTSGKSPALARKVREDLERHFGREYELFLNLMGRMRKEILARGQSQKSNSQIFRELIDSSILKAIGRGAWDEAASALSDIIKIAYTPEEVRKLCEK